MKIIYYDIHFSYMHLTMQCIRDGKSKYVQGNVIDFVKKWNWPIPYLIGDNCQFVEFP